MVSGFFLVDRVLYRVLCCVLDTDVYKRVLHNCCDSSRIGVEMRAIENEGLGSVHSVAACTCENGEGRTASSNSQPLGPLGGPTSPFRANPCVPLPCALLYMLVVVCLRVLRRARRAGGGDEAGIGRHHDDDAATCPSHSALPRCLRRECPRAASIPADSRSCDATGPFSVAKGLRSAPLREEN